MTKTIQQCSLDRLASLIETFYINLSGNFSKLTLSKIMDIQNQIRTGKYTLTPLKLIVDKKKEPLSEHSHIYHVLINDSIFYGSITTTIQEDELVLIALGCLLNTRIIELNLLNTFGFKLRTTDYYAHIRSIEGPISRVYKLDMSNSVRRINKESLLTKLEPIVENDDIMKLLKSFLYNQILYDGKDYSYTIKNGIPTSVFITDVLLNFTLIEFDNQFHQVFPSLSFSYTRYTHEVIVTTSQKDSMFESSLFALFERLNLDGKILSIGPGDKPMLCHYGGVISITEDGRLIIKVNGTS